MFNIPCVVNVYDKLGACLLLDLPKETDSVGTVVAVENHASRGHYFDKVLVTRILPYYQISIMHKKKL